MLEQNLDKVNWSYLSSNPNAIHLLEQNLDKVEWHNLSSNPNAIHLLEQNLDKVNWFRLLQNPNAIHLLEKNLDLLEKNLDDNWYYLSINKNAIHLLAKLDYNQMRLDNQGFVQDLVAFVCHPNWIQKCASRMGLEFDEYQDLLVQCNVI